MARQFTQSYTSDHVINSDGSVQFICSRSVAEWPWLALAPRHPIVIQAQNFWASIGSIMALGGMEEGQWSALTWTEWQCGDPDAEIAAHGVYSRESQGNNDFFRLTLFDEVDREIATMRGRGVVFKNRNFEEWREQAKQKAKLNGHAARGETTTAPFLFAAPEALGIGPSEHALVAPISADDPNTINALVSRENGLPPANPMLGGSGDHVNSVHMIEVARQALCLTQGNPKIDVVGGEMELNRYVELGTPFDLRCERPSRDTTQFVLRQLGKDCAKITLNWN
ncbi:hypothetical protein [Erythrobacter sp. Alg231-14]|uniref:hypothetical protein n=1 Tax=Erythrobacter sp. Alg231-14 TaxID=1922225 RepID=UPI00307B9C90